MRMGFAAALATVMLAGMMTPANAFADEAAPLPRTVAKGAELVKVYGDGRFFEGPTWDPKGKKLYFTAFGEKQHTQILRLDGKDKVTVWLDNTEGVNGTYLSTDGRLLGAQAFGHRVMSYAFGPEGPSDTKVVAEDMKWHQPNDVCQTPNGTIYFTDPEFNPKDKTKKRTSCVYQLAPSGKLTKVITDMEVPNGCIASNDGKTLYVGDSFQRLWRAYPIAEDGSVGEGKVFFNPDTERKEDPDGMSIDEEGNLYLSGRGGVWVADPTGKSLGLIPVPVFCSNVTFGGDDGKTLYLTCKENVYSLKMNVRGAPITTEKK